MSFTVAGGSEPQLWSFLIPSQPAPECHPFTAMDRRPARRRSDPHRRGAAAMHGGAAAVEQKQHRRLQRTGTSRGMAAPPGYFTAELVLAVLLVAVSLAFLPLVLPPLSPPPFLLLLVPVGLLAVLVALAFVPLDAQSQVVAGSPG